MLLYGGADSLTADRSLGEEVGFPGGGVPIRECRVFPSTGFLRQVWVE